MAQTNQSLVNWIKSKTRSKAKDSDHILRRSCADFTGNRRITDALEKSATGGTFPRANI